MSPQTVLLLGLLLLLGGIHRQGEHGETVRLIDIVIEGPIALQMGCIGSHDSGRCLAHAGKAFLLHHLLETTGKIMCGRHHE